MSRTTLYEYRAWPSEEMPHIEALHHLFGLGVSEIRTDTYIFSSIRPHWLIVLHGGTEFEILEKTGEDAPLSSWKVVAHSEFPLRRNLVRALQEAFPMAQLPQRILVPGDVISWLDRDAAMFTVSKRTVQFQREGCVAEFTEVDAHGRRAQTFSLTSKRSDIILEALDLLPAPRLPNIDYGTWLQRVRWNVPARQPVMSYPRELMLDPARVAC
ncbi:MAG: hypothetical protein ACK4Y9_07055 [Hyphomonas sp.]